jgi:hypothetical protein
LLFTLFAVPAAAQQAKSRAPAKTPAAAAKQGGEEEEVERKIVGGGKIAAGWTAKVDRNGPVAKVKLESSADGVHIETAASAVFYKPADRLSRNYHLAATFTQNDFTPGHAEPYGLIFGGEVRGDTLNYTYFMVQSDGKFSVRRRTGTKSQDLGNGWMENKAVAQADKKGVAVNRLMVERTPSVVRFLVNGTEVFKTSPDSAHADGLTGVRVSHNLSVDVSAAMRMQM